MNNLQRRVTLALLSFVVIIVGLIFIAGIIYEVAFPVMAVTGGAFLVHSALLVAYWYGWNYASPITVALASFAAPFSLPDDLALGEAHIATLIPPILAMVLTGPASIVASGAVVLTLLLIRSGFQGAWAIPQNILSYVTCIGGMMLGRLIVEVSQRHAEENARRADAARLQAEEHAEALTQQTHDLAAQNQQQRQLLDLVALLETPAVPLTDGVLLAPIIGAIDQVRAERLTTRMLQQAFDQRARLVILDIAGVSAIDTGVAQTLVNIGRALKLLGCDVAISGVSAEVAMTLTQLQLDLGEILTVRSPQEALLTR